MKKALRTLGGFGRTMIGLAALAGLGGISRRESASVGGTIPTISARPTKGAFGRGFRNDPFKRARRANRFGRTDAARIVVGFRFKRNRVVYVY